MPVSLSFWNNLLGVILVLVAEDWGVEEAALISFLNSRFGEDVHITIFLDGGVVPGAVGRAGCGVSCLDGAKGFLIGVSPLGFDLGVVECRASALLRRLFPRKAAKLGLPVSDATV